ncbi:MAG: hypothetical protein ACR2QK_21075, partial [Acidimicrobiales bacterium]
IDDIIDAAHRGARRGTKRSGTSISLIVCVLRHRYPIEGAQLIEAIDRVPSRVQGVDIAGPEAGHPARPFRPFLAAASARGLGITIHAGEAVGVPKTVNTGARTSTPTTVEDELDLLGASSPLTSQVPTRPTSSPTSATICADAYGRRHETRRLERVCAIPEAPGARGVSSK